MINQVLGFGAVTVWDVDELPEDWIDFFMAVHTELPQAQERHAQRQQWIDRQRTEFFNKLQHQKRH